MCVSQVVSTELDTDNLKLDDLGDAPGMEIGAELEAIMLTGACIDTAFETNEELHPRGTQLLLQDSRSSPCRTPSLCRTLGTSSSRLRQVGLCSRGTLAVAPCSVGVYTQTV